MAFRSLEHANVISTIERLQRRISERFPTRALGKVCSELAEVAKKDRDRVRALRRPYLGVRVGVFALAILLISSLLVLLLGMKAPSLMRLLGPGDAQGAILQLVQGIDSGVNVIAFFGVGLYFLLRHEERQKRNMALEDLYELRAFAHVIDMHQLTKDPTTILRDVPVTAASGPREKMTAFELARYLDYCSEMLSLVAKVGAFYAQDMRDPVVIATVSDLESMTTNLSRKVWQKIVLVEDMAARE